MYMNGRRKKAKHKNTLMRREMKKRNKKKNNITQRVEMNELILVHLCYKMRRGFVAGVGLMSDTYIVSEFIYYREF